MVRRRPLVQHALRIRAAATVSTVLGEPSRTSPSLAVTHLHRLSPQLPESLVPSVFVEVYPRPRGVFTFTAPLPQVGARRITLEAQETVNDVLATVQAIVGEDTSVRLRSASGAKLAGSTHVSAFVGSPWRLDVGGFIIGVASARDAIATVYSRWEVGMAFERLRDNVIALKQPRISMARFEAMCKEALDGTNAAALLDEDELPIAGVPQGASSGASSDELGSEQMAGVVRRWKLLLEEEGMLLHFSHAVENELRDTVFVQPNLHGDVIAALDVDGDVLRDEIMQRRHDIGDLKKRIEEMEALRGPAEKSAHRYMNSLCYLATAGMVTQFSWLAHQVYASCLHVDSGFLDAPLTPLSCCVSHKYLTLPSARLLACLACGCGVCWSGLVFLFFFGVVVLALFVHCACRYTVSWDVMEPFIYFLDLGYVMLFYVFFLRTSQDPNFDNIFGNVYNWQLRKRLDKCGYSETELERLDKLVDERSEDLSVLLSRLGRPLTEEDFQTPPSRRGDDE